ncbi:hypothetical protein LUZ63_006180 [Rhynchospora breviuscula]|uniref:Endonuclease/exonuclease/phosphatase domain-containing protein n=1 Tax=Rhynchospora breviuscula TaxID=2022672 RepID=A0A9Q0CPP1_9POAL|nr:hypothetical protein LUZ63_006180 [Rhynchospora breviuscula]
MSPKGRRKPGTKPTPTKEHTNGHVAKLKPIILLPFPNVAKFTPFPKLGNKFNSMLKFARKVLHGILHWSPYPRRRQPKFHVVINCKPKAAETAEPTLKSKLKPKPGSRARPDTHRTENSGPTIRIATFNAALFSMAPAIPNHRTVINSEQQAVDVWCKSINDHRQPKKSILKNQSFSKSSNKLRVSINLPENEISVEKERQFSGPLDSKGKGILGGSSRSNSMRINSMRCERSVLEVLKEVDADVIALQNVRCEEEKAMKPLSDLADGLGMRYVFADSWAPEYGNAVLSRWPIRRSKVQRICDDSDFRNVIKITIDVPELGEVSILCTHLDHLDEKWRMKQINSILRSTDGPHILTGGLNTLDETDYSAERWADIVKYYEEIGKPTPKVEVMKYLKQQQYVDAKNFSGECEAVVVVAKGQDVQGTCKYGTRVDYILASPNSPYKFIPGSYGVVSSKGTSDHHIVKVDLTVSKKDDTEAVHGQNQGTPMVVKIDHQASSKAIFKS